MEVRSESIQVRCDKLPAPVIPRTRLQVWFIRVCICIFVWTCVFQLLAVGDLWGPHLFSNWTNRMSQFTQSPLHLEVTVKSPPPLVPLSEFFFNEYFVSLCVCCVALMKISSKLCSKLEMHELGHFSS